jgi:hypothetical protein
MDLKIVYLEAVLMPNGELLHYGKSLGYADDQQINLVESGACKLTKGHEPIVAIRPNIA